MASDHSDAVSISPSQEHVECKELDLDIEFGGTEARNKLERKFLWKLDLHMSMLVLISILNLVSNLTSRCLIYVYIIIILDRPKQH